MVYIFRQKYMLVAFCEYTPDYFAQLPYQSDTELKTVFRFENMDYSLETGLAVIIPFNVGRFGIAASHCEVGGCKKRMITSTASHITVRLI